MNQDPVSRTRDLHGAIGGATVRLHHKKRCSHVFIDSQTHVPSQGTEFVMNFAFEIRRESNPRGARFPPYLKCKIHQTEARSRFGHAAFTPPSQWPTESEALTATADSRVTVATRVGLKAWVLTTCQRLS